MDDRDELAQDDIALVARLASGDEAPIGVLYDRYGGVIYSLALRIVRDGPTAEDVTQEVFVRVWRAAGSFDPAKGKVSTWLLRIAHNLALNEIRRRKSRPMSAAVDVEAGVGQVADEDPSIDPATAVWVRERSRLVRAALTRLPVEQRQAIEMAYFGGRSQSEVAAALGEPVGTVKSRIRTGMQRLAELLRAQDVHP